MFRFKEFLKEQNNKDDEYKVIKTTGLSGGQPPKKDDYQPMKTTGLSGGQPPKTQTPKNKIIINPLKEDIGAKFHIVEKHDPTPKEEFTKYYDEYKNKENGVNRRHGYNEIAPIIDRKEDSVAHDSNHPNFENAASVFKYTRGSYTLNDYLHKKETRSEEDLKDDFGTDGVRELEKHSNKLSETLKSQAAPQDMYVYSGLKGDPRNDVNKHGLKDINVDTHIKARLPAFVSATVEPQIATHFADTRYHKESDSAVQHILKIKIPKDSNHGLYIGHHSKYQGENEFLIDKNKKMHIHPEPEVHDMDHNSSVFNTEKRDYEIKPKKIHIWHAHIVE